MSEVLIGKKVRFEVIDRRRMNGRAINHIKTCYGVIRDFTDTAVIIQAGVGLYNRPIPEVTVMEAGR